MNEPPVTMKVRPFEKTLDTLGKPFTCSGRIEGQEFILQVGTNVHWIHVVSVGEDEWGAFAEIEPSRTSLGDGYVLEVEQECPDNPELDPLPGCDIAIVLPADPARYEGLLRNLGYDPNSFNVIRPPQAILSLSFHSSGRLTGWGGGHGFSHIEPTATH
jgi:hypothetical protein